MGPVIQVDIPEGMGDIMESLTRAILKNQPNDIYAFAMSHIDSLLKLRKAQSSGLSPSPTEEVGQKVPSTQDVCVEEEPKSSVTEEKLPEEPESNDTSYGVEATAVRTLAASTGTVAILGTTAKVKDGNDLSVGDLTLSTVEENENIPNEPALDDELQNEYVDDTIQDDTVYSPKIESPDKITSNQQLGSIQVIIEKYNIKDFDEISSPVSESEENIEVENVIQEKEETKIVQEPTEQPAVTEEIELAQAVNIAPISEREPVRVVDYQEKKSKIHGPKIVEEMSVKKEDKVKDSEELSSKEEKELEIFFSIGKKDVQDETNIISEEPKEEEMPIPGEIEITTEEEEDAKLTPDSGPASPDASKTSDDNEISSEQLKTNSLSDMSLSDALNSEAEEAAREAAKAQELREMVASLSASANRVTLEYEFSEVTNGSRDFSRNDPTVGTSLQNYEEFEPTMSETSKTETVLEGIKERSTPDSPPYDIIKQHSPEPTFQESPTSLEVPAATTVLIIETSEDTSSSETSFKKEDKDSTKPEEKETLAATAPTIKHKKTEGDTVEEKEKDEAEIELENVETDAAAVEKTKIEGKLPKETDDPLEQSQQKEESGIIAAATAIQSGFRGYQVRKQLKESETDKEAKQAAEEEETEKSTSDEADTFLDGQIVSPIPELFDEKGQIEQQEKYSLVRSESRTSEPGDANEDSTNETTEASMKYVPDSLIKIAQAEVDKICKEAVETTEALATPPQVKYDSDTQEGDIQEEDFPAPPDDLLASDSKTEDIKDDHSSSGTLSTEPTMPLGNNHTEGDSSKTEDTTAPSLADSEMPKSNPLSPSQPDNLPLESSLTENINTEVVLQRDSTEGELTMEEDSTRDDEIPATAQSSQADNENSLAAEEEKAATLIQAGYRGFKARKRLREESSTGSHEGDESPEQESSAADDHSREHGGESSDVHSSLKDKSEKELNDSAKKIQAGVRGYLVRKKQKVKRDAAVTIQSHFRGFKTRQRLKQESSS